MVTDAALLAGVRVQVLGDPTVVVATLTGLLEDLGAAVAVVDVFDGRDADVLVTSHARAALVRSGLHDSISAFADKGVWLSVTPWGLDGPWAEYPWSDLVLCAESGLQYTTGDPDREPLRLPGALPSTITANAAFTALQAALVFRAETGLGQLVDVSALAVMTSNHELATVLYSHTGRQKERQGGRLMGSAPWTLLPCKDGWMGIIVPEGRWIDFVQVSGIEKLQSDRFATRSSRVEHVLELEAILTEWMSTRTEAELYEFAQALLLPWAPVSSLPECLDDPQMQARGFMQSDGRLRFPALFTTFSCAAPEAPEPKRSRDSRGPLSGLRVLDFGIAWAGALTGRQLGDLGADVIKIETRRRLDTRGALTAVPTGIYVNNEPTTEPWNRSGTFVDRHRNKRSIAIELDRPEGVALLHSLARESDIVIENFAPRVLENLGVGYRALSEVNPRIVYLSLSGFGHTGPRRDQAAFGDTIEQASGSTDICGYEGGPPFNSGTHWPDTASGFLAAGTAVAAWQVARRTGAGMHIDMSELEVAVRAMPDVIDYLRAHGEPPPRTGNRGWGSAFEGVFRSRDNRYVAVTTVPSTRPVPAPLQVGSEDPRDAASTLSRFVGARTAEQSVDELRSAGAAAGIVKTMAEVFNHEQPRALGFFQRARLGSESFTTIGFTAALSRSPMSLHRPAPYFSEHHREVVKEVLDADDAFIDKLVNSGAISTAPGL